MNCANGFLTVPLDRTIRAESGEIMICPDDKAAWSELRGCFVTGRILLGIGHKRVSVVSIASFLQLKYRDAEFRGISLTQHDLIVYYFVNAEPGRLGDRPTLTMEKPEDNNPERPVPHELVQLSFSYLQPYTLIRRALLSR